ncbi:MAG: AAA family ATPase [Candidatus Saccharimonadales bacterium]
MFIHKDSLLKNINNKKEDTLSKLLILSGAPSAGKSTLAQRYAENNPLALRLDIDRVRELIGGWQTYQPESNILKMELSYAMAATHLSGGHDVVVAQHIPDARQYERFEDIAKQTGSMLCEVLLYMPADEAVRRCIARGKAMGYQTGFRPGGVLESSGGEKKLRAMHAEMIAATSHRPNLHVIRSHQGMIDQTYTQVLAALAVSQVPTP